MDNNFKKKKIVKIKQNLPQRKWVQNLFFWRWVGEWNISPTSPKMFVSDEKQICFMGSMDLFA